jgi:hypothetical protein
MSTALPPDGIPAVGATEFSGDQIRRLLSDADRLGFGVRPEGFVLINRARLIETEGISKTNARQIDDWVTGAGGVVQPLVRQDPATAPKRYRRVKPRAVLVWAIPADALKLGAKA